MAKKKQKKLLRGDLIYDKSMNFHCFLFPYQEASVVRYPEPSNGIFKYEILPSDYVCEECKDLDAPRSMKTFFDTFRTVREIEAFNTDEIDTYLSYWEGPFLDFYNHKYDEEIFRSKDVSIEDAVCVTIKDLCVDGKHTFNGWGVVLEYKYVYNNFEKHVRFMLPLFLMDFEDTVKKPLHMLDVIPNYIVPVDFKLSLRRNVSVDIPFENIFMEKTSVSICIWSN